jgi:hypothetical protein
MLISKYLKVGIINSNVSPGQACKKGENKFNKLLIHKCLCLHGYIHHRIYTSASWIISLIVSAKFFIWKLRSYYVISRLNQIVNNWLIALIKKIISTPEWYYCNKILKIEKDRNIYFLKRSHEMTFFSFV